ncbi:hypothetical protein D3C81_1341140 [compost metagenome]
MADQLAPGCNLLGDPGALDGVGIFDGDSRLVERKLAHLFASALGLVEPLGSLLDESVIKHGQSLRVQGLTMAARVRSTSKPPRVMSAASTYSARLALWVVSRTQPMK